MRRHDEYASCPGGPARTVYQTGRATGGSSGSVPWEIPTSAGVSGAVRCNLTHAARSGRRRAGRRPPAGMRGPGRIATTIGASAATSATATRSVSAWLRSTRPRYPWRPWSSGVSIAGHSISGVHSTSPGAVAHHPARATRRPGRSRAGAQCPHALSDTATLVARVRAGPGGYTGSVGLFGLTSGIRHGLGDDDSERALARDHAVRRARARHHRGRVHRLRHHGRPRSR